MCCKAKAKFGYFFFMFSLRQKEGSIREKKI